MSSIGDTDKRVGTNSHAKQINIVSTVGTVDIIGTVPRRQAELGPRQLAPRIKNYNYKLYGVRSRTTTWNHTDLKN